MALDRRNTVIDQMVRNRFIEAGEASRLKLEPIHLKYRKLDENAGIAPYFREVLRDELKRWCRENRNPKTDRPYDIYKDGLKIFTTIDPRMQEYAEIAVFRHMQNLQKVFSSQKNIKDGTIWNSKDGKKVLEAAIRQSDRWRFGKEEELTDEEILRSMGVKAPMKVFAWNNKRETDTVMSPLDSIKYHLQTMQIGLLSVDPVTGEVKAWVGGSSFRHFKFDHVNVGTKRQVGSAFKPLLYTAAVMNGYRPETVLPDGPIQMGDKTITGTGGPMAVCLAYSKNPAAVYLLQQVGIQRTIELTKQCGITSAIPPYPSIALGTAEVSLMEMVQSYTMFPGRGFNVKPRFINRIEDRNGNAQTLAYEPNGIALAAGQWGLTTRLKTITDPSGRATTLNYGPTGYVSKVTDPVGRQYTLAHDAAGNLTSITDPLGRVTRYEYDAAHLLTRYVYPKGSATTLAYDSQRRMTTHTDALGKSRTASYGDGQNTFTDERGIATIYSTGPSGAITQIVNPVQTVNYSYNERRQLSAIDQPPQQFTYDNRGNLASYTSFARNSATYDTKYNQQLTSTDPAGYTSQYAYDAKGNLTSITDPMGRHAQRPSQSHEVDRRPPQVQPGTVAASDIRHLEHLPADLQNAVFAVVRDDERDRNAIPSGRP